MAFPIKNFRSIPLYIYERLKIHDPQSKYSAFILEEFRIMSHFEYHVFGVQKKLYKLSKLPFTKQNQAEVWPRFQSFPS